MRNHAQLYLQKVLNTNVTIEQLKYFPFKTIGAIGVVLTDADSTQLMNIGSLKVDVSVASLWRNGIVLTNIEIDSANIDAMRCANKQWIVPDTTDTIVCHRQLQMQIANLKVSHSNVSYNQYVATNISIDATDLNLTDTTFAAQLNNFSATDAHNYNTPFTLSTSLSLCADTLRIPQLNATYGECQTELCNIEALISRQLSFALTSNNTTIDCATLRPYIAQLPANMRIDLKGQMSISNNKIVLRHISIENDLNTHIDLDGSISNYKHPNNATIDLAATNMRTTIDDVAQLLSADIEPTMGQAFGLMNGQITANGNTAETVKINAFVGSDVGNINAQANISELNQYTANISSDSLDLSLFTNRTIGLTSLNFDIDGDTLFAHAKGQLPIFTLRNYTYHDVMIDGIIGKKYDSGLIHIDDPNGQITIVGEYGKNSKEQSISITARIADLMTGRTNLTPSIDGKLNLSMRAQFSGKDIDSSSGELLINSFTFADSLRTTANNKLQLNIEADQHNNKNITINSNFLKAHIAGQFKYADFPHELYHQLYTHANAMLDKHPARNIAPVEMNIDLTYSDIDQYLQFVSQDLKIADNGSIKAEISSANNSTNIDINIGDIESGSWRINGLSGIVKSNTESMALSVDVANMSMPTLGNIGSIGINNVLSYNIMDTNVDWDNMSADNSGGKFSVLTEFDKKGKQTFANISVDESEVKIKGNVWTMRKSLIGIGHKHLSVSNFQFDKDDRFIKANGIASEHITDTLTLALNRITIEDILPPDPLERYSLGGDISTTLHLIQTYKEPIVNCHANIDRFSVDGENLEHLNLLTQWSAESKTLGVDVGIVTGGKMRAHGIGNIDSDHNYMQLNFDIDSLSLGWLNFYLSKSVSNIRGTTSGKLQLHGPLNDIGLDARLVAHRTDFRVKSTLTDYYFDNNDSVILSPHNMEFRHMRVRDKMGNTGYFKGNIEHDMYSNLKINLGFDVENMIVMDMKPTDNPTYYGTLLATGQLNVTGITNNVDIRIKAQTCPQSNFSVLPTAKSDRSDNRYIRFRQPEIEIRDTENNADFDPNSANKWVKADIDVHINPSAQLNVILDPRTDNKLSAIGEGNLRLVVDRSGDLQILGTYIIDEGTYNFSFENIVNKRFSISKGGTLIWDGDPFNPKVDLMATYKLKASLYDLVQNVANAQDLKKRVPINCNMFLTERINDPNIRFNIDIPSTMNFNQYTLDQYISTEEEMNRQVFSLLLANRFYASEETTGTQSNTSSSSYIGTTVSELVSNQLSNWISQNKYNIGVGVNYRPGDEVTQDEYEVALSTQMLDNKIVLSGNIGYGRSTTETSDGSLIGDFDVEVKLNKKGNLRAKAYTHSNNDVIYETSPTTQGIGISFREEFNNFRELIRKYWNAITGKRTKKEDEENNSNLSEENNEQQKTADR